jgi:glycosyltransferase involved in cell wall biosynthesis
MRIGIDARMYRSSVAGIGRYSQNLIKNLLEIDHENQYVLFMTSEDEKEFKIQISNLKMTMQNAKIIIANIPHYSIAEQTKLPKIIAKEKLDLMHFLNFNFPVRYKGKFIVTIHDLTLFFYPETAKQTNFIKRLAFSGIFNKAVKNAQKIIAVSQNTKDDIIKKFALVKDKIEVIYEAADDRIFNEVSEKDIEAIKSRYGIGDTPVILYVGQMRPHKNVAGLIEAFKILKKEKSAKLVLLGKSNDEIDKIGKIRDIVMPGFVADKELSAWLKIADVFCFPSFYEGFGLPGLEAMQAGTPVLAAKASSLPEIYQDAALYFDPSKSQDIADKIKLVLENQKLRDDLIKKGKEVVSQYSWKKTAQETLKLYQEI